MKSKGLKAIKTIFLCTLLFLLVPVLAPAQEYPTKPITMYVGQAAGSTRDVTTRMLTSKAEKILGKPFVIINNGAGGGMVVMTLLAKDKPDGYALTSCTATTLTWNPLFQKTNYQYEQFTPIMQFGVFQAGLAVKADAPYKTFKEFVEYAKKNPGKISFGSTGASNPKRLAMVTVAEKEGIQWSHIPYEGDSLSLSALLGGHIDAASAGTVWIPHIQKGTLRLLAVYGERRMKKFPDVPTLLELGYGFLESAVAVIAGPRGMSPSVVSKLDMAFHKAMDEPDFIQLMEKLDVEVFYRNSADLKNHLEDVRARTKKMIIDFKLPTEEGIMK
jgi:tripartite-type tricarboxylate transporter receptor subunit TctC